MSWIYGATGEMGFWNEQIRSEARVKKQWERTYGVSIPEEREAAEAKGVQLEELLAEEKVRPWHSCVWKSKMLFAVWI